MIKYEKPQLVEISELTKAEGSGIDNPDCSNGSVVLDTCPGGDVVTPGCTAGGVPSIMCGGGGTYQQ